MIAIDTSALVAILLREPQGGDCMKAIEAQDLVLLSAGTMAEALVVAGTRNIGNEMAALIDRLALDVVPVTPAVARRVAEAYEKWGKGNHPAGLNFGDCFAYEVARENACRLLYIGDDFRKTDIESVL